jgi:hypothetical protein
VRPHLKLILETLRPSAPYVISRSMDLLAWNPGGLALFAGLADWPATQRNIARHLASSSSSAWRSPAGSAPGTLLLAARVPSGSCALTTTSASAP